MCEKINENIMGINLANGLELSYNAGNQRLFSIEPIDNLPTASSSTIVSAKFMGNWEDSATYMATLYNPRTQFGVGGPALVRITEEKFC